MRFFVGGMLVLILMALIPAVLLLWAVRKQNCVTQDLLVKGALRREAERNEAMEGLNEILKLGRDAGKTLPEIITELENLNVFARAFDKENTAAAKKTAADISWVKDRVAAVLNAENNLGEFQRITAQEVEEMNARVGKLAAFQDRGGAPDQAEPDPVSPAMLEGFDNLMSYTERTARGERS